MKKIFWPLLIVIVVLGGYLRLINLDTNPPHLGNDEISIAYDGYSVRTVGKDEHGYWWPISFQSHQTYKAPLYAYLNMPINWLLGNTEYGVRLLSVLASLVAIIFIALIGKEIGGGNMGLLAAVLLTINPKNIFASRIAFESNVAMAVLTVGLWAMIAFKQRQKNIMAIMAGLMLGLSIWGYHTEWGLVPMILVVWIWLSRKEVKIIKWWPTVVLVLILATPIFYNFVKVQLFDPNNRASSQMWFSSGEFKDYLKNSSDNPVKKVVKTVTVPVENYLQHFSLDVNFSSGMDLFNSRSPLNFGWFLLATLPLVIIGLINGRKIFKNWWGWLISWWLLCPVIPAMTGTVASVRNLAFIVPTCLIMAGGAREIYNLKFKISKLGRWISYVLTILIVINFLIFTRAYYVHYPLDSGNNFQYGYKQAWEFMKPNINKYDRVVVENRFGQWGQFIGVPHLYFGYFGAFTAEQMQQRDDKNGTKIGKYEFKYVDWNQEVYTPKTIYVVSAINPKAGNFTDKLKEIGLIRNTNFEKQFLIYETTE